MMLNESGRKRRKVTISELSSEDMKTMSKKELRAIRNRESAYRSRLKKRQEVEMLRKQIEELQRENNQLRNALRVSGGGGGGGYAQQSTDSSEDEEELSRIPVTRQCSSELYARTLGFSVNKKKRSRNEYEDNHHRVKTNFETLQQSLYRFP